MTAINVIPYPLKLEKQEGIFRLLPETTIVVDTATRAVGEYLAQQLRSITGFASTSLDMNSGELQKCKIVLQVQPSVQSAQGENYSLVVRSDDILISAPTAAGVFYGCQTLLQLFSSEMETNWEIPQLTLEDSPRFSWRGMHLDVCRHFMPKAFIKTFLDLMARYKMNVFHWHLTDDQGWRIEINRYPKLTEVSAWRMENGERYGGFYSKDDVREIVEYARERFITVIPEIEMPGHAVATLAAYPELSCTGGPFDVLTTWGIFDDVYCAGNDKVFTFLENVLTEVFELFPAPYVHVGGDECPKTRWKSCPKCQERIRQEGLKDEKALQSYCIKRMGRFLAQHQKRLIGWDEILEGGLAPGATVMSWRGTEGGIAAAEAGHPVVMTPTSHCYFDYYQSADFANEPKAIGQNVLRLETVYDFDPIPPELSPEHAQHILGGQANIWTEYIPTPEHLEYMILPRMCALAETVWSDTQHRNLGGFLKRLPAHYAYFDASGRNYRHHEKS